jgi:predicted  nucleic acid-binding Zn-ribbon protein
VPEDAVDELYGLPLDEFTPRRDELAKALRAAGKRDEAAWVKALGKPSAAAWIVNQLVRTQKSDTRRMLERGDALRVTQERALARQASREELAGATHEYAEAMRTLLSKAPGFLDRRGAPPSQITLERAAETLRAVLLDDVARAGFAAGRLTREHRAAGLGFAASGRATAAPAAPGKTTKPGKRAKAGATATTAKEVEHRAQERARARAVATEARSRHRARQRDVSEARRDVKQAERELERAQRRLERAKQTLERALEKEAGAGKRVEQAEASANRPS